MSFKKTIFQLYYELPNYVDRAEFVLESAFEAIKQSEDRSSNRRANLVRCSRVNLLFDMIGPEFESYEIITHPEFDTRGGGKTQWDDLFSEIQVYFEQFDKKKLKRIETLFIEAYAKLQEVSEYSFKSQPFEYSLKYHMNEATKAEKKARKMVKAGKKLLEKPIWDIKEFLELILMMRNELTDMGLSVGSKNFIGTLIANRPTISSTSDFDIASTRNLFAAMQEWDDAKGISGAGTDLYEIYCKLLAEAERRFNLLELPANARKELNKLLGERPLLEGKKD